jgi:hypothetical protein
MGNQRNNQPRSSNNTMKQKAISSFIREHKADIDQHIRDVCGGNIHRLNDRERRLWLSNDEQLYLWAKSEGVRL